MRTHYENFDREGYSACGIETDCLVDPQEDIATCKRCNAWLEREEEEMRDYWGGVCLTDDESAALGVCGLGRYAVPKMSDR